MNGHEFLDPALGKAIPTASTTSERTAAGCRWAPDHDTASFAVATLRNWWDHGGATAYPGADRLLITADGGHCNGMRLRAWKSELAAFATTTGPHVTVAHLPPGPANGTRLHDPAGHPER